MKDQDEFLSRRMGDAAQDESRIKKKINLYFNIKNDNKQKLLNKLQSERTDGNLQKLKNDLTNERNRVFGSGKMVKWHDDTESNDSPRLQ